MDECERPRGGEGAVEREAAEREERAPAAPVSGGGAEAASASPGEGPMDAAGGGDAGGAAPASPASVTAGEEQSGIAGAVPDTAGVPQQAVASEGAQAGEATPAPAARGADAKRSRRLPRWVVPAAAVAVAVAVLGIAAFAWNESRYAEMPDVMGSAPEEAAKAIAAVSGTWEVEYRSEDDISALSDSDLNEMYEVAEVDPAVGERLERAADLDVTLTLEKNEETRRAEHRQEVIQREIDQSLANGWAGETYEDEGDVVVFRVTSTEPFILTDGRYWPSQAVREKLLRKEDPDWVDSNFELYEDLAEELESNIIVLCYTSDGYLTNIYAAMYSGTSEAATKRAAEIAAEARDAHMQKVSENLEAILNSYKHVYDGFNACEYTWENGQAVFYVYGNGYVLADGTNISNSSAQIESALSDEASSFSYCLQAPVTIKFIKDGALFAQVSAEPESMLLKP